MENKKRTQRTPQEIIAETEARLEKLRLRAAKADAKANPAVASLLTERESVLKELREAQKLQGKGPQGASTRIAKHQAWIDKINADLAEANDAESIASQRIAEIDSKINDTVAGLTASA